jgi:hypothetical protein
MNTKELLTIELEKTKFAFEIDNPFMIVEAMNRLEALIGEKAMMAIIDRFVCTLDPNGVTESFINVVTEANKEKGGVE